MPGDIDSDYDESHRKEERECDGFWCQEVYNRDRDGTEVNCFSSQLRMVARVDIRRRGGHCGELLLRLAWLT